MYVSILQDSWEVVALCEQGDCEANLNFYDELELVIGKSAVYFCSEKCMDSWVFNVYQGRLAVDYS